MLIFHNPAHRGHDGRHEMFRGRLVPCHESPARLDHVMAELQRRPVGELRTPGSADLDLIGQMQPNQQARFLAVTLDQALEARRSYKKKLACLARLFGNV